MKFTSEDLLKAMGLKVGQTVCVDNTMNFLIYEKGDIYFENLRSHSVISIDKFVEYILNFDYTIIQPKPTLTEDEKVILRNLPKEYLKGYIARDKNSVMANCFVRKPIRFCKGNSESKIIWVDIESELSYFIELPFYDLFQFIKWEDEPYSIEELLKEN